MKYITINETRINLDQLVSYLPYTAKQDIVGELQTWYYIYFRTHTQDTSFTIGFQTDQEKYQAALDLLDCYSLTGSA